MGIGTGFCAIRLAGPVVRLIALVGLWLSISLSAVLAQSPQLDLPRFTVTLETASGTHAFDGQYADTPQTRGIGLMFRQSMPPREGMLFDFHNEQTVSFWMENTPLPLDLIFARADGTVASIARDAIPFSRVPIHSGFAVRYVLEVNAGVADEIGLKPGDRMRVAQP